MPDKLEALIAETRRSAEQQLALAYEKQADRVREVLAAGWQNEMQRALREQFAGIEARLREGFDAAIAERAREDLEKAIALARESSQRDQAAQLNQFVRRLRQAESRDVWISTLLDAAASFCGRAALFSIDGRTLRGESARGGRPADLRMLEVPLTLAPAFANAVEAQDTVVAIGTRRELSDSIADRLGDTAAKKIYFFPLKQDGQVVGVLYAEPGDGPPDVSALELITELALNTVRPQEITVEASSASLVQIAGAPAESPKSIPREDREAHFKAQRFARNHVARMLLHRSGEVKTGRGARDLYGILREDIDAGREAFRQFFAASPTMVDYLHQELVRTLGKGHPEVLGPSYPGPLR